MHTTFASNKDMLSSFADQLLAEKNLPGMDPEVQAEIKRDLIDRLEIHVNAGLLSLLPKEALPEFDTLLDQENPEATRRFLEQHIPDMTRKLAEILVKFKLAYLNS